MVTVYMVYIGPIKLEIIVHMHGIATGFMAYNNHLPGLCLWILVVIEIMHCLHLQNFQEREWHADGLVFGDEATTFYLWRSVRDFLHQWNGGHVGKRDLPVVW